MTQIMGLIPARAGSKGVPRKNVRSLAGKPLIEWTVDAAQSSDLLTRILVSTDDVGAAEIARSCGLDVPFMRPAMYARDDSSDLDVYRHALEWLMTNESYQPDVVVWLRPTTPLRTSQDIDNAVEQFLADDAAYLRSVCSVSHHPYWMYVVEAGYLKSFVADVDVMRDYPTRQSLPPAYRLNGAVDISRSDDVMEHQRLYTGRMLAYVMPPERSIDIDTEQDFKFADYILNEREQARDGTDTD